MGKRGKVDGAPAASRTRRGQVRRETHRNGGREKQRLNRSIGWLPGSGDLNWEASRNAATGEAGFSNQECQNRRINEARRLAHHFTMEQTWVALPCAPALGKSMSCLPSWVPGFRIQILHSPRRRERSKRITIACKSRPKRHALPSFLGLKARPRLRLRYGWLPNSNFLHSPGYCQRSSR